MISADQAPCHTRKRGRDAFYVLRKKRPDPFSQRFSQFPQDIGLPDGILSVSAMANGTYRTTLRIPGLQAFLWTQFLGAFNDNVYKIIVSFYAMQVLGPQQGLPLAAAVFVLPFLLFSGWSGHLADAYSKRTVLIWTKSLEILAMGLALPALMLVESDPERAVVLQLGVLFLMATHSTFFSPAKYGIVPEAVPASELSRANGLLEMSTFVAIILGTQLRRRAVRTLAAPSRGGSASCSWPSPSSARP